VILQASVKGSTEPDLNHQMETTDMYVCMYVCMCVYVCMYVCYYRVYNIGKRRRNKKLTKHASVRGQLARDWILDDLQKRLGAVAGPDFELVEQLHHETRESLEGTRNAQVRGYFDQHVGVGFDIHFEQTRFVQRTIQQSQQSLRSSPIGSHVDV
jgi:hypothetical protein